MGMDRDEHDYHYGDFGDDSNWRWQYGGADNFGEGGNAQGFIFQHRMWKDGFSSYMSTLAHPALHSAVRFWGQRLGRFLNALGILFETFGKDFESAAREAAQYILDLANESVPYDTGELQDSGHILRTDDGFYDIIYDVPYAEIQHEETGFRHLPGRRAKWLELAIQEARPEVRRIMSRTIFPDFPVDIFGGQVMGFDDRLRTVGPLRG